MPETRRPTNSEPGQAMGSIPGQPTPERMGDPLSEQELLSIDIPSWLEEGFRQELEPYRAQFPHLVATIETEMRGIILTWKQDRIELREAQATLAKTLDQLKQIRREDKQQSRTATYLAIFLAVFGVIAGAVLGVVLSHLW